MTHPLLTPLSIRGLILPDRLFQAPLAGYSNWPFRVAQAKAGAPGLSATEMISAQSLAIVQSRTMPYLARHPDERRVQYQIWGTDPDYVGPAARICAENGADAIDLNCGCPAVKIAASGAGAIFMKNPRRIGACVAAMRRAVELPVSIKIRIGPDRGTWNAVEVAHIAQEEGADFLTIHGRHGKESYATPVRCDEIAKVVAAVRIPVIGNGDVRDGASADRLMRETGCAGVMVGRACMGNPWVFAQIRVELSGGVWTPPTLGAWGQALLGNFDMLAEMMGEERASRHIRKLAAFYSRGLQGSRDFRMTVNYITTRASFHELVGRHFPGSMADVPAISG